MIYILKSITGCCVERQRGSGENSQKTSFITQARDEDGMDHDGEKMDIESCGQIPDKV